MTYLSKRLAIGLACLTVGVASAEFLSGNDLLADMKADGYARKGMALGYVTGVADALMRVVYCPPRDITAGQVHDMVRQHLDSTPSVRHQAADNIIGSFLKATWPCRNTSQGGQSL